MPERMPRPIPPEISTLIRWTARMVYHRHVPNSLCQGVIEVADLEHQGIVGWLEAPDYDEALNTPITAFARPYVYGRMMDFLRKTLSLVRVPQDRWAEVRTLQRAKEVMLQAGETPGDEKLAAQLGWPIGKVVSVEREVPRSAPLDPQGRWDGTATGAPHELLSEETTPEQSLLRGQLAHAVQACLGELSARDRLVVLGRRLESLRLRDLAERLGCSMERVRQLEKRALSHLRECLEAQGWTGIEAGVNEGALQQSDDMHLDDATGDGGHSDVS